MSSAPTKHRPRVSLPDLDLRRAPAPHRQEKGDKEQESITLGSREPDEGRYDTLSRQTYRNFAGSPAVPTKDEVQAASRDRKIYNQTRNFYWNESPGVVLSESKGTHIEPSQEILRQGQDHDNKANMLLMTSSSIFVSDKAVEKWRSANSTARADFHRPSDALLKANRGVTKNFRKLQQGTHFVLGSEAGVPTSESRAMFRGEATDRAQKSKVNMVSTINIGSDDVPPSETLQSLKQVDFVNHGGQKQQQAVRNNLQRHNLVFGYQPQVKRSLYGASFTPTEFFEEEQPAVQRKPRY